MSEKDLKNFEKNEIAGNTDKVNRKSSINYRDSIHKPGDNNAHMANDNEGEFKFVNEKVVNNKRLTLGKLLLFLVMCGIIMGAVACMVFVFMKPYLNKMSDDKKSTEEINDSKVTESNSTTEEISPVETTKTIEERLKNMGNSVVTLCVNEEDEWENVEQNNVNYGSGLITVLNDKIRILTTYDFIKDNREVTVYLGNRGYKGMVDHVSEKYGLATVIINTADVKDEDKETLSAAEYNPDNEIEAGEEITFMGNPYGKEKFIVKGSLTSVGNTYNIVDTELEIMATDISTTGFMNGFAFDNYGNVIGMVNNELNGNSIGENVVSVISFKRIAIYVNKIMCNKTITYLGIHGKQVTDDVIENIDKDMPYGIYISNTEEKSPAYTAGVMNGDILTEFNGTKVSDFKTFTSILQKCQVGDEVTIKVMRKGKDGYKEIRYTVQIDSI